MILESSTANQSDNRLIEVNPALWHEAKEASSNMLAEMGQRFDTFEYFGMQTPYKLDCQVILRHLEGSSPEVLRQWMSGFPNHYPLQSYDDLFDSYDQILGNMGSASLPLAWKRYNTSVLSSIDYSMLPSQNIKRTGITTPPTSTNLASELWQIRSKELAASLSDLLQVGEEADEEGYPRPSITAFNNAKRLLKEMHRLLPRRFEVYPTPDAEIAIDAPSGHGASVLLLCDSAGGVLCLVNLSGEHRSNRYQVADTLPDRFLREALADLKRESN